jgi:U3 small nucleolar RNA-associated protein 20
VPLPQAILARKLVVPEVYDLMEKVQEIMIRSQAAPVRQVSSQVLLLFLLDYPLSPKRLRQHLNFVLGNLSYEHESGRLAAIDMLSVVVAKFPAEVRPLACVSFTTAAVAFSCPPMPPSSTHVRICWMIPS